MRHVARFALVFGTVLAAFFSWRLGRAFATEMDLRDVRFFALLYWAGFFACGSAIWGLLALRRLREWIDWIDLPVGCLAVLLAVGYLGTFAHMRIPAVRTLDYSFGRWQLTFGQSREVPPPPRNPGFPKP